MDIWLIFTRTVAPLEIFRWFPQIVFTLLPSVRPINVRFSNCFCPALTKLALNLHINFCMSEYSETLGLRLDQFYGLGLGLEAETQILSVSDSVSILRLS